MATKKGPLGYELPADIGKLSKVEREEITKSAKEALDEALKQKARDAHFDQETERLRRAFTPDEQYVNIVIDSAPYVPYFRLDGAPFYNGYEYVVTRSQACVLIEQMQRSWTHQNEIDGRSRFAHYRRQQEMSINPAHEGSPTRGAAGATVSADMEI
jgi:hypothetical protein